VKTLPRNQNVIFYGLDVGPQIMIHSLTSILISFKVQKITGILIIGKEKGKMGVGEVLRAIERRNTDESSFLSLSWTGRTDWSLCI